MAEKYARPAPAAGPAEVVPRALTVVRPGAPPLPAPGAGGADLPCRVVVRVPVGQLVIWGSPRAGGEDGEHVRLLAESPGALPPIVVHRPTLRVVDGRHRLRAAILRGDQHIDVCFFDGAEEDAFVLAVRLNAAHGLPLSGADRLAAALRIIRSHPHWSDRRIAGATGLAARRVAALRRSTETPVQSNIRVGKDGRSRPLSAAEGRQRAAEILADRPGVTLRAVAKEAGISLSTASDVKERLRQGREVVPARRREPAAPPSAPTPPSVPAPAPVAAPPSVAALPPVAPRRPAPAGPGPDLRESAALLHLLRRDPSLRFTEVGRELLRLISAQPVSAEVWQGFADGVPAHCAEQVARLARRFAQDWLNFAEALER
ncbi:ParB N-terminal domain-containing protein [Kitasatospora sp. NPDC002227]|uniref:ParB/RepB/Spo0J family partition protein n=1 Tax=Kitasatospora sp. NPDC002227 TaxID=3154773 RepID=UPI003318BC37